MINFIIGNKVIEFTQYPYTYKLQFRKVILNFENKLFFIQTMQSKIKFYYHLLLSLRLFMFKMLEKLYIPLIIDVVLFFTIEYEIQLFLNFVELYKTNLCSCHFF